MDFGAERQVGEQAHGKRARHGKWHGVNGKRWRWSSREAVGQGQGDMGTGALRGQGTAVLGKATVA